MGHIETFSGSGDYSAGVICVQVVTMLELVWISFSDYTSQWFHVVCCDFNVPSLTISFISNDAILLSLKKFKSRMTTQPNRIPLFLLRDCAPIFSRPLSVIFNLARRTNLLPYIWKKSKICNVFKKKGDRKGVENWRKKCLLLIWVWSGFK